MPFKRSRSAARCSANILCQSRSNKLTSAQYTTVPTEGASRRKMCDAASSWVARRSVAIVIGSDAPQQLGSGVVIELAGRIFLATVAHNFSDAWSFNASDLRLVPAACHRGATVEDGLPMIPLQLNDLYLCPSAKNVQAGDFLAVEDLAFLELDPTFAKRAEIIPVRSQEVVCRPRLRMDGLYAVSGAPFELVNLSPWDSRVLDSRGNSFQNRHVELGFYTQFTNPFASGLSDTGQQTIRFSAEELDSEGKLVESPTPPGMSGGGLWEVVMSNGQVACHLRGLIRAKLNGKLLSVPIKEWVKFFEKCVPELAGELQK